MTGMWGALSVYVCPSESSPFIGHLSPDPGTNRKKVPFLKHCPPGGERLICFIVRRRWSSRDKGLLTYRRELKGLTFCMVKNLKKNQGLRSMGGNVTDLQSKWVSLRPAIKSTLAATLLYPCKPRAKWLFSPTIPDTIWPHVKQLHYCASSPETGELTFISSNLLSLSTTLGWGLGYV